MFDSTPPNLPIEPLKPVAPAPKPVPQAVSAVAAQPMPAKSAREPEDIFSGLDTAAEQRAANAGMEEPHGGSSRSPILIIVIAAVSLVVLGGIGYAVWAFVLQSKPAAPIDTIQPSPQPQAVQDIPEQIEQPPVIEPEPQPVTQAPAGVPLPIPTSGASTTTEETTTPESPAAPVAGTDTDADQLTDREEALFSTNVHLADSDGDGFTDGVEVIGIYDPAQKGMSLTKNAGITPRQWNGMSLLTPTAWTLVSSPENPASGVLSTAGRTRFTLETRSNVSHQSLTSWVGSSSMNMKSFTTKNGVSALQSVDGLTTYLSAGDAILMIGYDVNGDTSYEYETTYQMMIQSFRPVQ